LLIDEPPPSPRAVAVIPVGEKGEAAALKLAHELRQAGFVVDLGYSGNVGRRMKRANKIGARAAVILGEDELARAAATLRDLDSGEQVEVPLAALKDRLAPFR
jgi:histidyl-tRNA synthetase